MSGKEALTFDDKLQTILENIDGKGIFGAWLSNEDVEWLISMLEAHAEANKRVDKQLEAKEREMKIMIAEYEEIAEGLVRQIKIRDKENERLREVMKWIVEHSIDYQAIDKARQALKGGVSE
jgi:hypothetical protein